MTESQKESPTISKGIWPSLVQFWIFASVATFFLLRVLGSHTAQRLLNELRHRHLL